ncbi:MAG: RimK/LysX family protein [Leptolyngbyaceae cyanobacterium]
MSSQRLRCTLLALMAGVSLSSCQLAKSQASDAASGPKQTVGWIEVGQIVDADNTTEFKLDTGAKTTSINAEILAAPDAGSEAGGMIRFRFIDTDGDSQVFERPIVEWVRIKDGAGGFFRRPVVTMELCVAGRWIEEKVNLADREQFDYSVLIGRNMLEAGSLVVDASAKNVAATDCPERSEADS